MLFIFFQFFFLPVFWPLLAAGEVLVPQPGIEPLPSAVDTQSPNHETTREVWIISSDHSKPSEGLLYVRLWKYYIE